MSSRISGASNARLPLFLARVLSFHVSPRLFLNSVLFFLSPFPTTPPSWFPRVDLSRPSVVGRCSVVSAPRREQQPLLSFLVVRKSAVYAWSVTFFANRNFKNWFHDISYHHFWMRIREHQVDFLWSRYWGWNLDLLRKTSCIYFVIKL